MRNLWTAFAVVATVAFVPSQVSAGAELAPLLARVKAVAKEGKGNAEASAAMKELVKQGPDALLDILDARRR